MNTEGFKGELVALLPKLRGYAIALAGSSAAADDLIQDSLMRAWRYRHSFRKGTNLGAWVRRILRNSFYSTARSQQHLVQDVDGKHAARLTCEPEQEWRVQHRELLLALQHLSADTRQALLLVVAEGRSCEEAAEIAGCPVGTIKSRVNRARQQLADLLDPAPAGASHHSGPRTHDRARRHVRGAPRAKAA